MAQFQKELIPSDSLYNCRNKSAVQVSALVSCMLGTTPFALRVDDSQSLFFFFFPLGERQCSPWLIVWLCKGGYQSSYMVSKGADLLGQWIAQMHEHLVHHVNVEHLSFQDLLVKRHQILSNIWRFVALCEPLQRTSC